MESLRENIKVSLDESLKKRDDIATSTMRLILAAINDSDIEFRTKKKGDLISFSKKFKVIDTKNYGLSTFIFGRKTS